MPVYEPKKILLDIEHAIAAAVPQHIEPMPGDRWILASAIQKAIRRGDVERALQAATALWNQDRQKFWTRLHIIGLEDCGVYDTAMMVKVLTATASTAWRRKTGDLRVGLYLTRLLCDTIKHRMADELFIQAEHTPAYAELREHFAKADDELLAEYAADEDSPLIERSLALWHLAGMKKFPSDVMPGRTGSPETAVAVLRSLAAPADLIESCIAVMGKTPWPLSMLTPLIWQEVEQEREQLQIQHNTILVSPDVDGIPLYAADIFTRVGKTCYRLLQKAVPELQWFTSKQIGLGMFYIEGGRVDKLIISKRLDAFRQAGELTDMESAGLSVPEYMALRECLAHNAPILESIRREQLQKYLNGATA